MAGSERARKQHEDVRQLGMHLLGPPVHGDGQQHGRHASANEEEQNGEHQVAQEAEPEECSERRGTDGRGDELTGLDGRARAIQPSTPARPASCS